MVKRFVYCYYMKSNAELVRRIAPSHIEYWKTRRLDRYAGGSFGDWSGGLVSFEAPSLERAMQVVEDDPFVRNDLLKFKWVREGWLE